jgi:hypothetical protein
MIISMNFQEKENGHTEKQYESDTVKDQDIRDMSNASIAEKLHLLFGSAHEEETRSIKEL